MQRKEVKELYDAPGDPVSEGVIMEGVLSHYVSPKTAISYAENMHNDTVGMMTTRRPFVSRVTVSANPTSCVIYQTPGGDVYAVWNQGGDMKYSTIFTDSVNGYASILASGYKTRFENVLGYLCMTTTTGQPKYWNDSGAPTAFGTSFPAGGAADLISFFGGYLWVSQSTDINNRVYYSDVLPSTFPTGVTGGTQYLTVNARLGDRVTGFASTQNLLYVFTHNNIFRISSTTSIDNSPIANVGAFSQEGIVRAKNGFYFYHPSGVYFLNGNQPQEISVKIKDILQLIPNSNHKNVVGWADDDHVYFSIGKLNTKQANKAYIIRYTISTQVWTIYSTLGFVTTCADGANVSSTTASDSYAQDIYPLSWVMGTSLSSTGATTTPYYGGTINVFTTTTENSSINQDWYISAGSGYPISCEYQTNWLTFDIENHDKRANGLFVPSVNAAGLKVAYQVDNDLPNVWRDIGVLGSDYISMFNSWQSVEFNRIKFRIYGETNGTTMKVGVPRIRILDDLGFKKN